jgi:hypothetical protein
MIRKIWNALPIAIVFGALLATPTLAQIHGRHIVQPCPRMGVSSRAHVGNEFGASAGQRGRVERQFAVPWIDDPHSPGG